MKLSDIGEFGLINRLKKKYSGVSTEILASIGDDAAAIEKLHDKTLITSDMMIEGVHFDLSFTTFFQLGYKFLAINISDIFAMGGSPKYFVISIGIPNKCSVNDIDELYTGIKKIAGKSGVNMIGGDTCASKSGLVLSGMLIGKAKKIIRRSDAKEGDGIFVSKTVGDSAMGLELLKKRGRRVLRFSPSTPRVKLMKQHLMPEPAPLKNMSRITSMIDISDGLLIDLSHICDESNAGAVIHTDRIPLSRELRLMSRNLGNDPINFALRGGEDYALLFTCPQHSRNDAVRIGEITKKGRYLIDSKGRKIPFKAEGYEHFRK